MPGINSAGKTAVRVILLVGVVALLIGAASAALLINIFERRQEGRQAFFRTVEITDDTEDPAIWGQNFPLQYDLYLRTTDMQRTRFGGSEAMPRTPTNADPRSIVARSRLEEDPRLKTMWSGYAFSVDFREARGHAYMLEDQIFTLRQQVTDQPGTCLHCHASMYVPYKKMGDGDIIAGFERMNPIPYKEAVTLVTHPISCIDCHNPANMQLRITRPGFIEGIRALRAAQGTPDYDVNRDATRREMRSYVCAQCHVEYYFRKGDRRLVYPWAKGIQVEDMLAYYDETGFIDWEHPDTGTPLLKAQHPEFEMWSQGIHAQAGVACADCHMPYTRVGAMKISDHHVRSPLLNIPRACQTCHSVSEDDLRGRAQLIQEKTFALRNQALDALMDLITDITAARRAGATAAQLEEVYKLHRHSQFMIDFVESENSIGFHASQETARILGSAIDTVRRAQIAVRNLPRP
jgi:nitrite reductase (cytochrome c-552)